VSERPESGKVGLQADDASTRTASCRRISKCDPLVLSETPSPA
jgi:hypothetical protein